MSFPTSIRLTLGLGIMALCAPADSISPVYFSLGPVPGFSVSYAGYTANAQSGVRTNANNVGGSISSSPTAFTQVTAIHTADIILDTGFNNWRGSANPAGAFANEYGTVLFSSVVLTGVGNDLSLNNITYTENDTDTVIPDYFQYSGSFAGSNYASDKVGILANGTQVAAGTIGTTMVNKIILTDVALGFDATGIYAGSPNQQLMQAISDSSTLGSYSIQTCFADSAANLSSCGSLAVNAPEPRPLALFFVGLAGFLLAAWPRLKISRSVSRIRYLLRFLALPAGVICAVPAYAQTVPTIDHIEINQSIGKLYDGTPNVSFVAGKATVVRAFMTAMVTVNPNSTSALITKDGQPLPILMPMTYGMPTMVVDFQCPSLAACGNWAPGMYVFTVTVNGAVFGPSMPYNFQVRRTLNILALAVKANVGGTVAAVKDDSWKSSWTYVRDTYPIADNGLNWKVLPDADASDIGDISICNDPPTNNNCPAQSKMLLRLRGIRDSSQPPTCQTDPSTCYGIIIGFLGAFPTGLAGLTNGSEVFLNASDSDFAASVAHETGHTLQLGDTYPMGQLNCPANPAPDNAMGTVFGDQNATPTTCKSGRTQYGAGTYQLAGTLVPLSVDPYDVSVAVPGATPGPLMQDTADFMGGGFGKPSTSNWITPDSYVWLFKQLAPTPAPAVAANAVNAQVVPVPAVQFSGFLTKAGVVTLQPWTSLMNQGAIPPIAGGYSIQAVDGNGVTLATQGFNVSFLVLTNPPKVVDSAPFEGIVAFPPNTAKFQILQGGSVLAEIPVGHSDPVVSQVTPTASGQTFSGDSTISWSAVDPDGNALTSNVEYTADITNTNAAWYLIAENLTDNSLGVDFGALPGGQHAVLRVTASDGVRSSSALSAQFTVPVKPPEAFIDNESNSNFALDDEIELSGSALDPQDGIIPDGGLVWSSNLSGKLGVGGDIVTTLPPGQHTVTLTATNSVGMSFSSSTIIRVGSLATGYSDNPATEPIVATSNFGGLITSAALPAGVFTNPAAVTVEVTAAPANNTPPAGLTFAGQYFNLNSGAADLNGCLH